MGDLHSAAAAASVAVVVAVVYMLVAACRFLHLLHFPLLSSVFPLLSSKTPTVRTNCHCCRSSRVCLCVAVVTRLADDAEVSSVSVLILLLVVVLRALISAPLFSASVCVALAM